MKDERGRADRVQPPGAQPRHEKLGVSDGAQQADHAAGRGEQEPFRRKQPPDGRRRKTDRAQQPNLANALFHAELEEERGQHHGRDDEKEAEVGEVLAEVRGAARRGQGLRADVADPDAERDRIDLAAEAFAELFDARAGRDANRRGLPVARSPEGTPECFGHKRLRRRSIPFPIVLVDVADAAEIDREGRVPVAQVVAVGDARIMRRKRAVGGQSADRHHRRELERRRLRRQAAGILPDVVVEGDAVAGFDGEITGRPLVQHDRRQPAVVRDEIGDERRQLDRRHQRVRRGPVAGPHAVDEIGEDRRRRQAQLPGRLEDRALAPFVDQGAGSFDRERRKRRVGLARQGSKVQSDIGGSRVPADERFEPGAAIGVGSGSARDEEGVQLSGRRNVVGIEPAARHERGADVALLRLE